MSGIEERGATAQLYRKVVEPSIRHLRLDCHPHHHNVQLHTAFLPETGHCRLGSAAGDNGRPLSHPLERQMRHRGILPKIDRSNVVLQPKPEIPCSVGSGSYSSVSQTKELPLLSVQSNEKGITLLPRHAAYRSISRCSQYRYLGTAKAVKDLSGDDSLPRSEQVRRYQEEQRALDHTRHLKRTSEVATHQHRINQLYYMSGSRVSLREKYNVDDNDLERLRASYEERSWSKASGSAHSRTGCRDYHHMPEDHVQGAVTIDLLRGTVSASSSDQSGSKVIGVLEADVTRNENEGEGVGDGPQHPHVDEGPPGEVKGQHCSDSRVEREESSSDSLSRETNNLLDSHHALPQGKGHSMSHHGEEVAKEHDASGIGTFVTQGGDEDGSGYEEQEDRDHLDKNFEEDVTHTSHTIGGTALMTQRNESDCPSDTDDTDHPVSDVIPPHDDDDGLDKSQRMGSDPADLSSSKQRRLDGEEAVARDVTSTEGDSKMTGAGYGDNSEDFHVGGHICGMDEASSTGRAVDDRKDPRAWREEMDGGPGDEQDEGDQTEEIQGESHPTGGRNGRDNKNQQEIGFGIVLDNTPYMATKQEIYNDSSFENPALKHFEDLATLSRESLSQPGNGGQHLLDPSQQTGHGQEEHAESLDGVSSLRASEADIDPLRGGDGNERINWENGVHAGRSNDAEGLERNGVMASRESKTDGTAGNENRGLANGGGDGDGKTDWDNGVYARVLSDAEKKERDEKMARRKEEKIERHDAELADGGEGGGDGKMLDIRAKLNLTDVYSFITARQRMIFQRKFRELDVDGNGKVTLKELTRRMAKDATEDSLKELVKVFDLNEDKTIDRREFVTVAALNDKLQGREIESETAPLRLNLRKLGLHITAYKEIFELVDKDKSGHLTTDEVMFIISVSVGTDIGTDKEIVDHIFRTLDVDGDGIIDFVEFLSFIPFFLKLHSEMIGRPASFEDVVAANEAVKEAMFKKGVRGNPVG